MEAANVRNKLILAVVQEDDYDTTVSELNQNGFFVTMLSSTGGFWKKKNITIMLGVEETRLEDALSILKQCAGKRKQTIYSNVTMPTGSQYAVAMPSVPVNVELGGVTVFVMDLERLEKL
ncbi:MAG: cyclic-di-AMP receptor [Oscillospiraceae bacterium]|mgnify:FL=1|nr:cyclic-di-AMP receptor [Oscillospiraceae bacterium]